MSNQPPADRQRRAPELRLPYPFLEYLLELPGDYAKLTLRLLQRAQWVPTVAGGDVSVDAGEVLLSLRSRDIWGAVQLDRDVDEAGRVSLLRRVLARLERDAMIAVRPAHRTDTPQSTRSGTRRDTPATIVRFLRYRDNLWPGNADATREAAQDPTRGATQRSDAIPSENPAVPATQIQSADGSGARGLAQVMDLGVARARRPRPEAQPGAASAGGSPRWDAALASLSGRMRDDVFARWIAPLRATDLGAELLLGTPDRFHRAFVEDNYRGVLEKALADATPPDAAPPRIRFVSPSDSAASPRRS